MRRDRAIRQQRLGGGLGALFFGKGDAQFENPVEQFWSDHHAITPRSTDVDRAGRPVIVLDYISSSTKRRSLKTRSGTAWRNRVAFRNVVENGAKVIIAFQCR